MAERGELKSNKSLYPHAVKNHGSLPTSLKITPVFRTGYAGRIDLVHRFRIALFLSCLSLALFFITFGGVSDGWMIDGWMDRWTDRTEDETPNLGGLFLLLDVVALGTGVCPRETRISWVADAQEFTVLIPHFWFHEIVKGVALAQHRVLALVVALGAGQHQRPQVRGVVLEAEAHFLAPVERVRNAHGPALVLGQREGPEKGAPLGLRGAGLGDVVRERPVAARGSPQHPFGLGTHQLDLHGRVARHLAMHARTKTSCDGRAGVGWGGEAEAP